MTQKRSCPQSSNRASCASSVVSLWVPDIRPFVLTRHDVLRSSCCVYRISLPFPRCAGVSGRALGPFQGSRDHPVALPTDGASPTRQPAPAQRQRSDPARRDRRRAPAPPTPRPARHPSEADATCTHRTMPVRTLWRRQALENVALLDASYARGDDAVRPTGRE